MSLEHPLGEALHLHLPVSREIITGWKTLNAYIAANKLMAFIPSVVGIFLFSYFYFFSLNCLQAVRCCYELRLIFLRLAAGKADTHFTTVSIPVLLRSKHTGLEISSVVLGKGCRRQGFSREALTCHWGEDTLLWPFLAAVQCPVSYTLTGYSSLTGYRVHAPRSRKESKMKIEYSEEQPDFL